MTMSPKRFVDADAIFINREALRDAVYKVMLFEAVKLHVGLEIIPLQIIDNDAGNAGRENIFAPPVRHSVQNPKTKQYRRSPELSRSESHCRRRATF